jgi:RluA family pseudouridine synthase
MSITILYEDEGLIALSKPCGQVVVPGRGELPGEPLAAELERRAGKKIYVIHRLDRAASGLILFAKDAQTHRSLSLQFERREVRKSYLVLVQGNVEADGRIDQPLRAFGSGRIGIHAQGKPSVTEYVVRERFAAATLLDVSPLTGRRHQIRVHLYSTGHPVMGDPLYGKDRPVGGVGRLMLHAWRLAFENPQGKQMALEADPSPDFQNVLNLQRS